MTNHAAPTYAVNGPAIRTIRKLHGIGPEELAARVGVKRPYIVKIELGTSRRVSVETFDALVAALAIEDRRALLADPYGSAPVEQGDAA